MSPSHRLIAIDAVDWEVNLCSDHVGLAFHHLYIICGGYCYPRSEINPWKKVDCSKLYVYNTHLRQWFCLQTSGDCPQDMSDTAAVIDGCLMYVIDASYGLSSERIPVYKLDLSSLVWSKVEPVDIRRPTPRIGVSSWIHNNKWYIYGGHGLCPSTSSLRWPNYEYMTDGSGQFIDNASTQSNESYLNTQLLTFHMQSCRWSSCQYSGDVPCAREGHQTCLLGDIVVLFGGRRKRNGHNQGFNDVYTLDMKNFVWKRIDTIGVPPCGRQCHSLSAVSPRKLVMYGGMSMQVVKGRYVALGDMCSHSAVVIDHVLYIHGGCDLSPATTDIIEIRVDVPSLHSLCHRVIASLHDLYPPQKLSVSLPRVDSLRVLASRGDSIPYNQQPLLELMQY